jgi:dolichyl-phosphate beta-glucosyltransferase
VRYSIIIPAFNERLRIEECLLKVIGHVAERRWHAEIIIVNDGSTDETPNIVRRFMGSNPHVRLIENPGNRGKGFSVRHGMSKGVGEVLLLTDADLSAPINEAKKLFDAIEAGADVAIGSRWLDSAFQTKRQSLVRQLGGRAINYTNRWLLGLQLKDTQCGFKAFTRDAAKSIFPITSIDRWGWDPEVLYLAGKIGFNVAEIPVEWAHDDRSKISPVRDGISILVDAWRVRRNAMMGLYKEAKRRPLARAAAK